MSNSPVEGFRITERDLEIVRWIGRQRFVEIGHVVDRFGMAQSNAYRRLQGLRAHDLLAHRQILHGRPGAYWATRAGLRATGPRLPVAGVDIRTYDHDRLAVSVAVEVENEFAASVVLTERELRSHDAAADQPAYAVALDSRARSQGRRSLHFPDLAVERDGERPLAIEVELTAKGSTRLDGIIGGYVRARHIDSVRYYASAVARPGVERAIGRAGAEAIFDVRSIEAGQR